MARKEHPVYGVVNERIFSMSKDDVEDSLPSALEELKKAKRLHDYRLEKGTLRLWRPWIEGQTQDEYFKKISSADRLGYSGSVFRGVLDKVMASNHGHGALHPRNIFVGDDGLNLVDEVFNRVRFDPLVVDKDDPWLWGPCVPRGWGFADWDLVSLLRTEALLAQDPAGWERLRPRTKVAEICREWASRLSAEEMASADFQQPLAEAVALLPAIVEAEFAFSSSVRRRSRNPSDELSGEELRREIWNDLQEARRLVGEGRRKEARDRIEALFALD